MRVHLLRIPSVLILIRLLPSTRALTPTLPRRRPNPPSTAIPNARASIPATTPAHCPVGVVVTPVVAVGPSIVSGVLLLLAGARGRGRRGYIWPRREGGL